MAEFVNCGSVRIASLNGLSESTQMLGPSFFEAAATRASKPPVAALFKRAWLMRVGAQKLVQSGNISEEIVKLTVLSIVKKSYKLFKEV